MDRMRPERGRRLTTSRSAQALGRQGSSNSKGDSDFNRRASEHSHTHQIKASVEGEVDQESRRGWRCYAKGVGGRG